MTFEQRYTTVAFIYQYFDYIATDLGFSCCISYLYFNSLHLSFEHLSLWIAHRNLFQSWKHLGQFYSLSPKTDFQMKSLSVNFQLINIAWISSVFNYTYLRLVFNNESSVHHALGEPLYNRTICFNAKGIHVYTWYEINYIHLYLQSHLQNKHLFVFYGGDNSCVVIKSNIV